MKIMRRSQKGQILEYFQKTQRGLPASDFVNPSLFSNIPYIGYSANTRICDLVREGLLKVSDVKIAGIKKFFTRAKERNIYEITLKGLKYKLC